MNEWLSSMMRMWAINLTQTWHDYLKGFVRTKTASGIIVFDVSFLQYISDTLKYWYEILGRKSFLNQSVEEHHLSCFRQLIIHNQNLVLIEMDMPSRFQTRWNAAHINMYFLNWNRYIYIPGLTWTFKYRHADSSRLFMYARVCHEWYIIYYEYMFY